MRSFYLTTRPKTGLVPRVPQEAASIPEEQVTRYVWRTQCDGKVRSSHAQNNGKIFDCTNPPETGNPGEDYGCRCWAEKCVSSDYLPHDYNLRPDNPAKPVKELRTSEKGAEFIAEWESFVDHPYPGEEGQLTIGYGHVILAGEKIPDKLTHEEALELFRQDLSIFEKEVQRLVKISLTQNQYDALVSLLFNFGGAGFAITDCRRYINALRFDLAKPEFLDINKVMDPITKKLVYNEALANRRIREWDMFENGIYDAKH